MNAAALLLCAALGAGPAAAESEPAATAEARERAQAYLGAIDVPIRPEQWRALGPAGAEALEEEARRSGGLPSRRARAIEGLSAFAGEKAERAALDLARSDGEPFAVRSAAVRAAGRLLGGERLAAALRPLVEGPAPASLRGVAAEVLVVRAPGPGCPVVRAAAARAGGGERRHLDRALRACGR